ncbi:MAG: response regulator transcription factor [Candidatus Brocadiae bacterium]|nr:response regulator transcription factor [Candidatus Brocadiia bacterium]
MHILIADDEITSRVMINSLLRRQGHTVVEAYNGLEAWEIMQQKDHPKLVILDWVMPEMDGIAVCQNIRSMKTDEPPYVIMLTAQDSKDDIVRGLAVGANDYIGKPYEPKELQARVSVGVYTLELQSKLAKKVRELEEALEHIKILQGILPICSFCKRIRNDHNYWEQVEEYIIKHSSVTFSHGVCPDCLKKQYPDIADKILKKSEAHH